MKIADWQFLVGHFSDWPLKLMNINKHWWTLMSITGIWWSGNRDNQHDFAMSDFAKIALFMGTFCCQKMVFYRQKCLEIKYRDSLVLWRKNSVEIYLSQDPPRGVLFGKHLKRSSIVLVFRTRGGEYALNEDVLTWLVSDAPNNRFALERLVPNYYTYVFWNSYG